MNGGSDDRVDIKENDLRMRDELDIAAAYAQASASEPQARSVPGDRLASREPHHQHMPPQASTSRGLPGLGGVTQGVQSAFQRLSSGLSRSPAQPAMSTSSGTGGGFSTRGGRGGLPPSGGGGGGLPPSGGPGRPERPSRGTPPQRPANYQPEERYWTDYLRIALPVVGLLLMLGLFLFWVEELIGDETDPTNTPDVALVSETNVPPTETATVEAEVTLQASSAPAGEEDGPSEGPAPADRNNGGADTPPTATATTQAAQPAPTATTAPVEEEDDDPAVSTGGLAIGATATINDNQVNLRAEATTGSVALTQMESNTTVTILDGPVSAEDYQWWQIELPDGTIGWVVAQYLTPA